jgi:25S rRNA (uracil2843-N3)-methyltransferase
MVPRQPGQRQPGPKVRPGENTKPRKESAKPESADPDHTSLALAMQQILLDTFRQAYPFQDATNLQATIQEVKAHLYHRDFIVAFGKTDYLEAYALRWSASRALCYTGIFAQLETLRTGMEPSANDLHGRSASRVVCIGGGAGAEVAALAAAMHASDTRMEVTAVDIADWSGALNKLETALTTPLTLSAYASEAVRMANRSMIQPERLKLEFVHQNILDCGGDGLRNMLIGAGVCTIMFTLNELFTSSVAKTTALLLGLGELMDAGAWLLIVDSPGSYSEVKLVNEQKTKRYPMKWLLDHTLMEIAKEKWEKVMQDDSRWFRIASQLKYPIQLEDMRYQIHVYRRIES